MMKKYLLVGAVLALVIIALGAAGLVYAQTQTPPTPAFPGYGPGMMGGRGGMMGGYQSGNFGPMHEYMVDAYAEAPGINLKLQDRLLGGEYVQIALSLGSARTDRA
jgi:hypothetical protein